MEKRRQTRTEVTVEVDMTFLGTVVPGLLTRNLSLGGVLLEAGDYPLPRIGAAVELTFKAPVGEPEEWTMQARVARAGSTEGVALLFREFDLDDFAFLQKLLEK